MKTMSYTYKRMEEQVSHFYFRVISIQNQFDTIQDIIQQVWMIFFFLMFNQKKKKKANIYVNFLYYNLLKKNFYVLNFLF